MHRSKMYYHSHMQQQKTTMSHVFGTADRLLEGARGYQIDSQKANNICEIITYEGQGHGFFNMGEYYNLTLAAADTFFIDCGWLSKP